MPERSIVHEKRPKWGLLGPNWWHQNGIKMAYSPRWSSEDRISLRSDVAGMTIQERQLHPPHDMLWEVKWGITHFIHCDQVEGQVVMDTPDLLDAFGFTNFTTRDSKWLIEKYGGTAAQQGTFLRYRDFLNIPCPGTGHDGDPNLSLKLDDEIKEAVFTLLVHHNEQIPPEVLVDRVRRRASLETARVIGSQQRVFEALREPK